MGFCNHVFRLRWCLGCRERHSQVSEWVDESVMLMELDIKTKFQSSSVKLSLCNCRNISSKHWWLLTSFSSKCLYGHKIYFSMQKISLYLNDLLACCGFLCGQGYNSGDPISVWWYVKHHIFVPRDFTHYKSWVYKHISGTNIGGHSVKLIGWKTSDDGEDYWVWFHF